MLRFGALYVGIDIVDVEVFAGTEDLGGRVRSVPPMSVDGSMMDKEEGGSGSGASLLLPS